MVVILQDFYQFVNSNFVKPCNKVQATARSRQLTYVTLHFYSFKLGLELIICDINLT